MVSETDILGIIVAAVGGAAVGVERQKSGHATGRRARLGGIRTFTLLGGLAGLGGWLTARHEPWLGLAIVAGAVALVIVGYRAASRHDVDATTEVAALVVIGAGVASGLGALALASGIIAVSVLLLVEKSELHTLIGRMNDAELRAAARFGVMAIVILPLLPQGPIGPYGGVKPRELWLLVLFFTGLSFIGYLARRLFGATRGYAVAGLLGGLISSTNVTFTFSRLSRRDESLERPLAIGAIGACTMLFPRVIVAAAVLNPGVARALLPWLATPFAIGVILLLVGWKRQEAIESPLQPPSNPLHIAPALEMAALFQIVLFAVRAVNVAFGDPGLVLSGAILGLTDVDALTISMTRGVADAGSHQVAAAAITMGILANCVLKTGLALALGAPRFRRLTAGALGAMAVALLVSLRAAL